MIKTLENSQIKIIELGKGTTYISQALVDNNNESSGIVFSNHNDGKIHGDEIIVEITDFKGVASYIRGILDLLKTWNIKGTEEHIKVLLNASKTLKMKAMILAQLSSGLTSIDMLNLKVKDFENSLIECIDAQGVKRKVCMLNLVRQKTDKKYTTFFSEEAVLAIENIYSLIESTLTMMKLYLHAIKKAASI
jgi:hypothetical protein